MNTPYYLLEEVRLRRNLALIKDVADRSGAEIILAFKAFALWKTFPIFREYIQHTTASSPDEARLALEEFGSPAHTYSPAYTERDFPIILRCSSHITFNSLSQYRRFAPLVHEYGTSSQESEEHRSDSRIPSLGLRVNPEYSEIETELYNPCAPGSRFGVLASDLPSPSEFPEDIEGFHIHCHCESSAEAFARTLVHIINKFSPWFQKLKWINFGGGHLMTRKDYNVELLIKTLRDFHARWPHLQMILEPGSAFAWQTGPLVASVVDIVENHGTRTAILDVSFTCHMPDCLEMPYYPEVKVRPLSSSPRGGEDSLSAVIIDDATCNAALPSGGAGGGLYRLGGNSCLSGDFMSTWLFPCPLSVGDEIIFEDMIHYTTVKTTTFNGVHHPSLVLQHLDGSLEVLREYTYEDYRDRMD
jgi:carboxynorspermidine decarboxylase